jgi:hypothetical protein
MYSFASTYSKYKMADTTNQVEGLHSVRRKYVDKRLNFASSYGCRGNLAILATYLDNWQELVLKELEIDVTDTMRTFFQVIIF